jgi:DNA-binding MarR family transcriptional regulator
MTEGALDHEARVSASDHAALRLWLRLLTCCSMIEQRIRARLRSTFNMTLPRFDLMAQLERAPQGLTMSELSRRLMVTGGNVTGLTDQLVAEGLVQRESVPGDRRACAVRLTAKGRRVFMRMAAAHERWIIELTDGMPAEERETLHRLLGRLKSNVAARAPLE